MSLYGVLVLSTLMCLPAWLQAQNAGSAPGASKSTAVTAPTPLQKSVESYLRHLYALGPNVQLTVSVPKDSEVPGLLETNVDLKDGENSQAAKFYVSKDGKYLVRG